MKQILTLILISLFLTSCFNEDHKKVYQYSGVILEKGKEDPTSGYKSSSDAKYYVIMRENKTQRAMRVDLTVPQYYHYNVGDAANFYISNYKLYNEGNTSDWKKNFYGE